jgi:hypothetical protein
LYFAFDIPHSLAQVFYRVVLEIGAPDVLDRVAQAKAHVLSDLYALDPGRMLGIVPGVVHRVVRHLTASFSISARSRAARRVV